uniref:Putative secreted protein n=1 Tax=Anopheles marajoara TaxID=58244 RepID=A0A2M4CE30_9DIPT
MIWSCLVLQFCSLSITSTTIGISSDRSNRSALCSCLGNARGCLGESVSFHTLLRGTVPFDCGSDGNSLGLCE